MQPKKKMLHLLTTLFFIAPTALLSSKAEAIPKPRMPGAGEWLHYTFSVGQVRAGRAWLMLKRIGGTPKNPKVTVVAQARTNTFFDNVHRVRNRFRSSFVWRESKPSTFRIDVDEARRKYIRQMRFSPNGRKVVITTTLKGRRGVTLVKVPPSTRDLLGAAYWMRMVPYKAGKRYTFYVFVNRRLWKVQTWLVRKERYYGFLGGQDALKVEGVATRMFTRRPYRRRLRGWVSADSRRIPLRLEGKIRRMGYAVAILDGYRKKFGSRTRRAGAAASLRRGLGSLDF